MLERKGFLRILFLCSCRGFVRSLVHVTFCLCHQTMCLDQSALWEQTERNRPLCDLHHLFLCCVMDVWWQNLHGPGFFPVYTNNVHCRYFKRFSVLHLQSTMACCSKLKLTVWVDREHLFHGWRISKLINVHYNDQRNSFYSQAVIKIFHSTLLQKSRWYRSFTHDAIIIFGNPSSNC